MIDELDLVVSDRPEATAADVNRRIADWLHRLNLLLGTMRSWATAHGWTVGDGPGVPMHEELMRKFEVPETVQPSLHLLSPDGAPIWIKPKGLWVIGANGRVDLYSRQGAYALVDLADAFEEPNWILHYVGRGEGRPFDPALLRDMA